MAFIVAAAVYIRFFQLNEEDPAGFMALSFIIICMVLATAAAAAVMENILH